LEELIKYIVSSLVDDKEAISINSVEESAKVTVVTVLVASDDVGKVIGRNGKVAGSIRTIVKSASMKSGKRYIVKIGERD